MFIAETKLITDSVTIAGYATFRKDRGKDNYGGICAYADHKIGSCRQLNLNCCKEHEMPQLR